MNYKTAIDEFAEIIFFSVSQLSLKNFNLNMPRSSQITRREFIQLSAGAAIGYCILPGISDAQESASPKVLLEATVPGYKLSVVDFVSSQSMIAADGKTARSGGGIFMLNLPFPHTSKPVTVYVHTRPGSVNDDFFAMSMEAYERGQGKRLDTQYPKTAGAWQWLRFKPLAFAQVGGRLRVDAVPNKNSSQPVEIESIVISTRDDLDGAALESTFPFFPAGPVARVVRAATAPVIDGRGDDDVWKSAVAIDDFLTYNALRPAKEATTARLVYDDKNLYILFENVEPLLIKADMRQSELKTTAKTRDGDVVNGKLFNDVLNDDACTMMLQPHGDGPVYEFTVNANGVMADAKMARGDLWATRDLSWNSHFTAAARQGEGEWTLEMAIPLADIGASAPQAGERWQVVLARLAAGRGENSSWNPSGAGAHRPLEMGTLIFDEPDSGEPNVAVVPASPLQNLQPGINKITAQIAPSVPADMEMISRIAAAASKTSVQTSFFPAQNNPLIAQHEFTVAATETATARWGVLEAATMQPIYLSPPIHVDVQSLSMTMELSTPSAYQVIVNDEVLAKGEKAENVEVPLHLRSGANVIALRADAGVATIALDAPGLERFDSVWRASDAATPNATSLALDDRAWSLVKADAKSTFVGNGPTVFRRTILVNQTPVWPVPQPALYIAGGSTQPASFVVKGLAGKSLENWTTYLAVPEELQVLGATGYYGNYPGTQPKFHCEPAGQTVIDGQTLPLYKISADKPLLHNRNAIRSIFQVMLQIADNAQAREGVSWKLHYWSQADDGTVIEAPRSFEVRALPPLKGRQPQKLIWELWGSNFARMDSEPLRLATLATVQAAGFNHIVAADSSTSEAGKKYGIGNNVMVGFEPWTINLAPYLKTHPDERLINSNGKPQDGMMCTTLLVGEGWTVAAPLMADFIRNNQPAGVNYDYEFSPLTGPHACYCDRCLTAFRKRAKLAAEVKLTPRNIEDQYLAQWQDFMAYRAAQILAEMKETTHQTLPSVPFYTYSLFQSPRTLADFGVDWRYIGQLKSVDIAEVGSGRPLDEIRATYQALDGIPVMMGVWMTPYSADDLSPARVATKAELLRRALDSTAGTLIYDRNAMDGRSWLAVAETTRLIAEYESTFIAHQLAEIPGQDSANVQLLKGDKQSLLCLMNETSKPVTYNFLLPAELGGGKEFYSGQTIAAGGAVQSTVQAGDTMVYVLTMAV